MDHVPTTNQNWFSRFTRGASITALGLTAISIGAVVIIWNADLYATRDRWEHIKLALYGDWQAEDWCPSGRNTKECTQANEFEAAFADVDNFNFFKSKPIGDTGLLVTTGVKFATARDVLTATTNSHWCYITYGSGAISSRLDLGMQDGQSAPVYADLNDISNDSQTSIGLSVERLHAVARTHCQFGPFDLTEGKA
jgi:hypothetical protein